MANVRCPMCSKVNAPDAEVCAFCGARLKPVRPASAPSAPPPAKAPQNSPEDEPDWLRGIRQDSPAQANEPASFDRQTPDETGDEAPDWLSRLSSDQDDQAGAASFPFGAQSSEQGGDEPDWMRSLQEDAPSGGPTSTEDFSFGGDWLDRLQGEQGATPAPADASTGGQEFPADDWLKGFSEPSAASTGEENTFSDWSSAASPLDFSEPANTGKPEVAAPSGDDDWMRNLSGWGAAPAEEQPAKPAGQGQDDEADWLSSLQFDSAPPEETARPEPPMWEQPAEQEPPRESSGFGLTGFLSRLDEDQKGEQQAPAPQDAEPWNSGQGDAVDWSAFTAYQDSAGQEDSGPSFLSGEPMRSGDDLPNWLSGLQDEPSAPRAAPESGGARAYPAFDAGEGDDWLTRLDAPQQPAAPAEDAPQFEDPGIPDWLSGGAMAASGFAADAGAAQESSGEGLPSWMSNDFSAASSAQGSSPSSPVEENQDEGLPTWMSGDFASTPAPASGTPAPAAGEETGLPSWLMGGEDTSLSSTQPADEAPVKDQDAWGAAGAAAAVGLPSWLSDEPAPVQPPASASKEPDLPVFDFSDFEEQQTGTPASSLEEPQANEQAGMPDWLSSFEQETPEKPSFEDTQPTWLSGVAAQTPAQEPPAEASEAAVPFIDESVPDWLRDFNTRQPAASGAGVPPLVGEEAAPAGQDASEEPFAVDLPDWLSADAETQSAQAGDHALAPAGEEQLARADMPEWVKDMRPIESILPGEAIAPEGDERVEKAGPLAGMRGVLPAEEMVAHYRKLPVYSVKLRVTEKQRSHASLLENILAQETQAIKVPPQRSTAPRVILRVLVALLLIFVLTVPQMLQLEPLAMPAAAPGLAPDELQDMFEAIDSAAVQNTAPVLLAVDFEPGMAGEMRLAAAPVIEHLMARNARVAVVSTVPGGPALAQALLADAAQNQVGYDLGTQTVNLGYLPGGAISLLEFARQPRLAAPVTLYGLPAWENTLLSEVSGLQDFAEVIVLTDSPETGRAWVEQVQPAMGSVPLLMVASAQAAPMLQPYVQSGQINGMVSGMLGGVMYSQQSGIPSTGLLGVFSTYQIGVLMAFVLVLSGGLVSGIRAIFSRREKDEE